MGWAGKTKDSRRHWPQSASELHDLNKSVLQRASTRRPRPTQLPPGNPITSSSARRTNLTGQDDDMLEYAQQWEVYLQHQHIRMIQRLSTWCSPCGNSRSTHGFGDSKSFCHMHAYSWWLLTLVNILSSASAHKFRFPFQLSLLLYIHICCSHLVPIYMVRAHCRVELQPRFESPFVHILRY
jgi:hypothetical protein